MLCVEIVDYSMVMNGKMVGSIVPGWDGDRVIHYPRTYLFFVLKIFHCSLSKLELGIYHDIKIYKNSPFISHLIFATIVIYYSDCRDS